MTATLESATIPATASIIGPIVESERLPVLDILRGFAILGMFLVHSQFNADAPGGGAVGATIQQAVDWFVQFKAYATFAILIGVSFAIHLRSADTRGEDVRWRFFRRLVGVWIFGAVTAALMGGADLMGYAWSGVWLLLVRRWSTRALLAALLATATLHGVWNVAVGSYQRATIGVDRANEVASSSRLAWQAADQELRAAQQGTSFTRVVAARFVKRVYLEQTDLWGDWQRAVPGRLLSSLSDGNLTLFLIGLLAFRLGAFERPAAHRRLLVVAMLVGAALWAVWRVVEVEPALWAVWSERPWDLYAALGPWRYLALTYIGAITLLVGFSKGWERRLAAVFGAAGRLALTNYLFQIPVLALAFGVTGLTPQLAILAAVILFGTLAIFSRWWLKRFRLGPAEWLLRSLTYARLQPLRRHAAQGV
jgi:uncharacterized protein